LVTWVVLLFLAVAVLCASPVRSTISTPEWQNNFSDLPKVVFRGIFSSSHAHLPFRFRPKRFIRRQNFACAPKLFRRHFCF
jgi:hypothetical protein